MGRGLRLGSSEIYGANVFRIDLAFPLDDRGGLEYGPLVSASLGQVFSFFGNDRVLSTR